MRNKRQIMWAVRLIALLVLLWAGTGWGATVYVKAGSAHPTTKIQYKSGASSCDEVGGWTDETDIEAALSASGANGICNICEGTYADTQLDATDGLDTTNSGQQIIGLGSGVTLSHSTATEVFQSKHTGTVLSNITLTGTATNAYNFYQDTAGITTTLNDCSLLNNNRAFAFLNGNIIFNMCKTSGGSHATYGGGYIGAATVNFTSNSSYWENCSGPISILNGAEIIFNNSDFIGFYGRAIASSVGAQNITLNNCIAFGNYTGNGASQPFTHTGTGTFTTNYCSTMLNGFRTDVAFNGITENNPVNAHPLFVNPRREAWASVYIDDYASFSYFKTQADLALAQGVNIVYCASAPDSFTAEDFAEMYAYIQQGHDIAVHGDSHVNLTIINAITVTVTGRPTPTISVAITQTDNDSDNWTGTVLLKENGATVKTITLPTDATTIAQLITSIDAQTGWDAVAHAAMNSKTTCKAVTLIDITNQSLAEPFTLQFEPAKLWHCEIAESKHKLEAGIGHGFIINGFAPPYNASSANLRTFLSTENNFTGAGTTAFRIARGQGNDGPVSLASDEGNSIYTGNGHHIFNIGNYSLDSLTNVAGTQKVDSLVSQLQYIGAHAAIFAHYNDSNPNNLQNIISRMKQLGVKIKTAKAVAEDIRDSGLFTDADSNGLRWTKSYNAAGGDFRLLPISLCGNTGTAVGLGAYFTLFDSRVITDASGNAADKIPIGALPALPGNRTMTGIGQ